MAIYSELVEQMLTSEFYPHSVTNKIKLIQTHASYVFLTGEYVYKVKKEVDFGFLDYSTLAKREYYITQELELNQKIAPELYLEVIPISKQGDRFILGSSDNVCEYTLKMRQFLQENLFSNLLQTRKLDHDRLKELGKIVAEFHDCAQTNEYIASFGSVDQIRIAFDENYQQTKKYLASLQTNEQYQTTQAYSDRFFSQYQDLFRQRVETHKIKECHGDLHLKNICLWRNQIQLFDRIEFNMSFRFVDTMYDVAFIVMDLEANQRQDLANVFLNSYLEYSGDWEGLQILPLYLSRQAYVRAKVNSFLSEDSQVSQAKQQLAQKAAQAYYRQAYDYTQTQPSSIIMMSGLSGSGKSTVAKEIAKNIGAIQLRSDAVRKHLAGISLNETGDIYTPEMTQKTYDRILELGIMLTRAGYKVILDAKYDRIALRQAVIKQAQANNIPLKIVHCDAPIAVLRDRLNQRKNDISDATAELLASQQAKIQGFTKDELELLTTVDTSQNWQNLIPTICRSSN